MMTPDSARDDLAFLRGVVQAGDDGQRPFGEGYFAGGLCYSIQMLGHGAQGLGWLQGTAWTLAISVLPTVAFIGLMIWLSVRHRNRPANALGKAIAATFGAVGMANLAMIVILVAAAIRHQSLEVWLLYPAIVMVLQGAAWMVAWTLQRRPFPAVVAAGWFTIGIGMGLTIGDLRTYTIICGVGLFLFMLIPGAIMMRAPKPA